MLPTNTYSSSNYSELYSYGYKVRKGLRKFILYRRKGGKARLLYFEVQAKYDGNTREHDGSKR